MSEDKKCIDIDVSCSFLATKENSCQILKWVNSQITPLNLDSKINYHIQLCIEEVVVNIINYAYKKIQGEIELSLKFLKNSLLVTVKDHGIPFNPVENFTYPDKASGLEERPIGGLGVYFLNKLMDSVEYIRRNDSNILMFKKKI